MPLYLAAWTIETASYLEFLSAIFTNYRVQNAAARLIFQESRFCHITPLLKSLHWLPVKYRIVFKIILITFKAIHGLAPAYISELISVRDTRRYDFRSNDGLLLAPCRGKTLTTLRDRSFHAAAPKLWNDLLGSIRNNQSLNKFKRATKTFLFAKALSFTSSPTVCKLICVEIPKRNVSCVTDTSEKTG